MKNIVVIVVLMVTAAYAQNIQLKLSDHHLNAGQLLKLKSGKIGLITMNNAKNAKVDAAFGYWIINNTSGANVFIDVKDGIKTIASVTAKDFAAKAKMQSNGLMYRSGSGVNALELTFSTEIVDDDLVPFGKAVRISLKVKAPAAKTVSASATLFADGYVNKTGTNGIATGKVEKGKASYPLVILTGGPGTKVLVDDEEQKIPGKMIKIQSEPISAGGNLPVTVLSFQVSGTTVRNLEKSIAQAKNVTTAILEKKEITELAVVNTANNENPFPADTVIYTIYFTNIGTAFAQNVEISNPIPENMTYVENSASGADAEISVERATVAAPQKGEATVVRWKIKRRILPGEEGFVTMKTVVR